MAEQEQQWWEKFTKEDYPDTHKFLNKGHNKDAFSNLTTKAKDKHIEINAIIVQVDKKLKEADFGTYTLHSIDPKYTPENIVDPTGSGNSILFLLSSKQSDSFCKNNPCSIFFGSGN